MSLSPGKGGFCSLITNRDRITDQRTNLNVSARRLPEQNLQTRKVFRVRADLDLGTIIIPAISRDTYRIIRLMIDFRKVNIDIKFKHLSDFVAVKLRVRC